DAPLRVGLGVGVVDVAARGLEVVDDLELLRDEAPAPLRIACLHGGEPTTIDVPAGTRAGFVCERTAYPLVCASANRLAPGASIAIDPGSYLLLARAPGRAEQRTNVVIDRRGTVTVAVELAPATDPPEGFVCVPGGAFVEGGDAHAFQPRERCVREVPTYFIARKELTNGEWYEFVNDPQVAARIVDELVPLAVRELLA